nr:hypothetical protein [uncultured Cohaesibacter sp.]
METMNVFWPVYKQLEERAIQLGQHIHISDDQLDVYSSSIADIIIRSVIEIEAIVKQLYLREIENINSSSKMEINTDHKRFDDMLKPLRQKWLLDKKIVYISNINCFQTEKVLTPFVKDSNKTGQNNKAYSWNNAYQDLKHDRQKYLKSGNLRNMFSALSAVYLLNLYFRDDEIDLKKDSQGSTINPSMGSTLFSIEIAKDAGFQNNGSVELSKNHEESVMVVIATEETRKAAAKVFSDFTAKTMSDALEELRKDPSLSDEFTFISDKGAYSKRGINPLDALPIDIKIKILQRHGGSVTAAVSNLRYIAVLNKAQFR